MKRLISWILGIRQPRMHGFPQWALIPRPAPGSLQWYWDRKEESRPRWDGSHRGGTTRQQGKETTTR